MRRWVVGLTLLGGVQVLLLGIWWEVERARTPVDDGEAFAQFEALARPAPELRFSRWDGSTGTISASRGPVVVHFWATWCPPCLDELPALLAWAERSGATVIAASVDTEWLRVERFLSGTVPAPVVLVDAEAPRTWGAEALPTTFLVREGRITHMARGAVDWEVVELP
ncbi:MAG: TlpA family protein disulfide reductase [Deltaproteobacteria bacterium]|nr:TlpA family protein disulfide reductase [Deltaproteobacteria bacterium]